MDMTSPQSSHIIGILGEKKTIAAYQKYGYEIIEHGYIAFTDTRGRKGEIDIICKKDDMIIFVEVKSQEFNQHGHPLERITRGKLKLIYYTIQHYLKKHPEYKNCSKRFDVSYVVGNKVSVIPNAYQFDGY
jgi:putative endonuclease